jgi:hypothetical protein
MSDSTDNSNKNETTSQTTSTEPLKEFAERVKKSILEASVRYGNNTDLYLKEHPEHDRRISWAYRPTKP